MSQIIHPIHTVSQKCRPKHQVLVLKCYPKFQKTVQEVKPNSSELSYLLYYVSTRRPKLQKVGAFLEKKTASDVWRNRLGNVQVTLQILTALIEKCPRDLALYSHSILTILNTVIHSKDISMVEESIPTFETYCKHLDASSWAADKERSQQFLHIVQTYTTFASKEALTGLKVPPSPPIAIRWRTAGLKAIRSIVGSEAFATESDQQLSIVMPVVLENLYSDAEDVLASLQQRAQTGEKVDMEKAKQRRLSMATVTTVDTIDANPVTASGTTADADKEAEDEVRALAVRCLKHIFAAGTGSNRGQIRLATALTLKYIASRNPPTMTVAQTSSHSGKQGNWATSLIEAVAKWTPVQDRFIIVVTAMETLVRSPIAESSLEKQLTLATMIDWLLRSSINLIGLSVMDVLLGFIQHTLLLLQLNGRDSKGAPHPPQIGGPDPFRDASNTFDPARGQTQPVSESTASPIRQELLLRLQKCIGDLATHIYYTDQISDMMTAILARLKPSAQSDVASTSAAIEDPAAAARAIAKSASLQEDPSTDGFFSFATARVIALRAVKDILVTANFRKSTTGAAAEARSRVGVQVWEGTQWLLRDEDRAVRYAYVDALLTWLKLETNKSDLHLPKDGPRKPKPAKKPGAENEEPKIAKRAVSGASRRENKPTKSTFLQLLHLAIYDNALDTPETDSNILLLHLLLTNLIERLGVNAVRPGLPMIFRLQEVVLNNETEDAAKAKVNVASLVHGYLWALTEKFDLETTRVGSEINTEIARRKRNALWLDKVRFPPLPIDQVVSASRLNEKPSVIPEDTVGTIKPYLNRFDLVLEIANAYDSSRVDPQSSPPASPGRVFSVPTLGFGYGYGISPGPRPSPEHQMPQKVKDEMLFDWSRESCIAAVEKESTKTASISGSRAGTSSGVRNHLTINGAIFGGNDSDAESPTTAHHHHHHHHEGGKGESPSYGLMGGLANLHKLRRTSTNGSPQPLTNSSSRDSMVRVTDLKRALSGYNSGGRHASPLRRPVSRSRSQHSMDSDSMVSYHEVDGVDGSSVDVSIIDGTETGQAPGTSPNNIDRPSSSSKAEHNTSAITPTTAHNAASLPRDNSDPRLGDDVPPVPKIPSSLNLPGTYPRDISPIRPTIQRAESHRPQTAPQGQQKTKLSNSLPSSASLREGRSLRRGNSKLASRRDPAVTDSTHGGINTGKVDLGKLLASIQSTTVDQDVEEKENSGAGISVPPY